MKSGDVINIDAEEEVNPLDGIKPFLYSCLPLIALFVFKFTFQHFNDGLILLGLNLVALKLNSSAVRQVQLKNSSNLGKCVYLACVGGSSVLFALHTFTELGAWRCLFAVPISSGEYGLSLWLVIFTDSLLKLVAVTLKLLIIPLSPKLCDFYRRGCLFSCVEFVSRSVRYFGPGMQLCPYILSVIDPDSMREMYFSYLLLAFFLSLKFYFAIREAKKIKTPLELFFARPNFGQAENKTFSCDLSQKVVSGPCITLTTRQGSKSYSEQDLLHWMASFGTCPETGVIHSPLAFGDGRTSMNVNLF